ncbi:MAG TPA: nicotinate phosphoribosyltransferase [Candidatus Bathyarchaeia archaeon]|nr:nicotinate phosphoribosyltransferase [Candidatus Bathyarchaeia archaeon]
MEGFSGNIDWTDIAYVTDFYELTMAAAYYYSNYQTEYGSNKIKGIFEMFVRKLPRNRSYLVTAGLEQVLYFLMNVKFNEGQLSYLKSLEVFKDMGEDFFEYLRNFKFTGNVWAVPEGTILFPNEPMIRVEAPIIEAQIVETYILSMMNFQSLIATKASRIVTAAKGKSVIEFGSRRAHGPQAALLAARASYIAGCVGTSNTLAGYKLGIPIFGTSAHSFIMSFEKEVEALKQFNKIFPSGYLLVDTYDTVAAIRKIIKSGITTAGIRLDSGDLYSLSVEVRRLLDSAPNGYYANTKIMASGDLNEYLIHDLLNRGAPIDSFGVGTELSTSRDDPAMNGVYKLVAIKIPSSAPTHNEARVDEKILYKAKTSPAKRTYPGPKQIYRIFENGLIKNDFIALENEEQPPSSLPLLQKILDNGSLSKLPSLREIQRFHLDQIKKIPLKFLNLHFVPQSFAVFYSKQLEATSREFKPE